MPRRNVRSLKDYLLPHRGNAYKPAILTTGAVAIVIIGILMVQAAFVFQTKFVFLKTDFLASVLPGVLTTLTNKDRAAEGVAALIQDPLLSKAAQMKADDMAARGYFSHVDPDGHAPWYWFDKVGYGYTYAGENLAVDFTDSKDVETAWMNSPTHRANIVKPQYTRIGIGVAQGVYQDQKTTFVVQFFATPQKGASGPAGDLGGKNAPGHVLGAETQSPLAPILDPITQVLSSPNHVVTYVLGVLAAVFLVLLLIAIFVHARVQYLEVIGGGLLIILVALSLLVFDALGRGATTPSDSVATSAPGA